MIRRLAIACALAALFARPALALPGDWQACLASVFSWEGGYAERPQEPGGCAYRGLSLLTLQKYRNDKSLTCADLKKVTEAETGKIYAEKFGGAIGFDALPAGYDCMALHVAIMFGPGHGTADRPGFAAFDAQARGDLGMLAVLAMRAKMYRDDCGPIRLKSGKLQWFCRGWADRFLSVYQLSRAMQVTP